MRPRRHCSTILALLTSGLLASFSPALAADPPVDAFLCRRTSNVEEATTTTVFVEDHLSRGPREVRRPRRLCEPVSLNGNALLDGATHLAAFRTRSDPPHQRRPGIPIETELGEEPWDLHRPTDLLLPAAIDASTPPSAPDPLAHSVDAYRCYQARSEAPAAAPGVIDIVTAGGEMRRLALGAPRQFCIPAEVDGSAMQNPPWHLACYAARPAERGDTPELLRDQHVATELGALDLDVAQDRELCLPAQAILGCDGSRHLCERRFDEVAYATTHNAMSNIADGFVGPNQSLSVFDQLEDGVRGLMLDTHYDGGETALCHSICALGSTPLVDTLEDIRDFLVRHPYEVVSIIFESYVSAADTEAAFSTAGLLDFVHAQPVGVPWPTLEEMITTNRRLVVFTDNQGGTYPWYHHVWAHAFETHYSWSTPASMNCNPNRGNPAHPLFILNHFLTQVFGSPALAQLVNHNPFLINRALQCQAERGTLPNFVTVDFHNIGDVLEVVAELNQ